MVEAGAVGINLEDSLAPGGPLSGPEAQAARIGAAPTAAAAAGRGRVAGGRVCRISLGQTIAQAAYSLARRAAAEVVGAA